MKRVIYRMLVTSMNIHSNIRPVVPRHRRHLRPRPSRRKALLDPKPRSRRNRHNLDPMVFRHYPQEHAVRSPPFSLRLL